MENNFIDYLVSKGLSNETIRCYTLYYDKLLIILKNIGYREVNQDIIDVYIATYPNRVCRAFMNSYLRYKALHKKFETPKVTGREEVKKTTIIPQSNIIELRRYFYDKNIRLGFVFDLIYYGALRREEVIKVRIGDFNLEELKENPSIPARLLIKGKGKKERYVIIPKTLLKAIIMYAQENKINRFESPFKIGYENWGKHFALACMKLGYVKEVKGKILPLYHSHSLRHSKSTEWHNEGKDLISIQYRLGHKNISTTRRYISVDDKTELDKWGKEYD